MSALSRRGDLLDVDVERAVWTRGGRPIGGVLLRFGFAGVFLILGLAIAEPVTRIVFIMSGVAVLLALQPFMDRRLEAQAELIARSDRPRAAKWLAQLETQRVVKWFAPHAWVALQRGRLHLVLGNGRAAAKAFADCARICGHADLPALVSAQAHGLLLAGDRKDARALLVALDGKGNLSPRDRLDLGVALLEESGRAAAARAHLEGAREQLGDHPRVLAGLALALARSDAPGDALPILAAAQAAESEARDEQAAELIKRARKTLRPALEAAEKRERKAAAAAEQATRSAERAAPSKRTEKKQSRKERREKRREASGPSTGSPPRAEAEAKQRAEAEAKQRAEAEAKQRAEAEAKQRAEAEAEAKQRAEAEAKQRAEAEARRRADDEAASKRRAEEAAAAAKRRADDEAAAAKRRADEEAAAAKRRADEEEQAAKRREAAAGPSPVFMPPPMPSSPVLPAAPPRIAAPPIVAPSPTVAAPPVVEASPVAAAAAIDASGWDDLLGDAAPPATPKKD